MNASPVTNWEGVEAYFTFADKPTVLIFILAIAIGVTCAAIAFTFSHENESYQDYQ